MTPVRVLKFRKILQKILLRSTIIQESLLRVGQEAVPKSAVWFWKSVPRRALGILSLDMSGVKYMWLKTADWGNIIKTSYTYIHTNQAQQL